MDYRQARASAEKAIALDPKLAAAYLTLGMVQINHDFDWEGADASLKRAAVLAPGSVEVVRYQAYVAFLRVNLGILIQKVEAGPSQSKM